MVELKAHWQYGMEGKLQFHSHLTLMAQVPLAEQNSIYLLEKLIQ